MKISTLSLTGALHIGQVFLGNFRKQYLHMLKCLQGFKIIDLNMNHFYNLPRSLTANNALHSIDDDLLDTS